MRKLLAVAALVAVLSLCVGCVMPYPNTVFGPIMVTKGPLAMGDSEVGMTKVGKAQAEGIIIVAVGDASIKAACEDGGITRIHHVDTEELNVLGIYARKLTIVYGE